MTAKESEPIMGVPAAVLSDDDLDREIAQLHRTRHDAFLHAGPSALATHSQRSALLEEEYERRHPARQIDPQRLRVGARLR